KDIHMAEDVTQSVFIILAQKAKHLSRHRAISPWLLVATRYAALDALKAEARLKRREGKAAAMAPHETPGPDAAATEPDWEQIAPVLDAALARLSAADQEVIALRYFEQRPLADVAALTGVSTPAVKKRVGRALLRLR